MTTAYLLVSHGSSDPRHRKALMRLAQLVRQQLENPPIHQQSSSPATVVDTGQPEPATLDGIPYSKRFPHTRLAPADANKFGPAPPLVGVAMLEATALSLAEQIATFGHRAAALGVTQVVIAPLFLLPGVHVMEDLPREIATAQQRLGTTVQLHCTVHLGGYDGLQAFLAQRLSTTAAPAVLVAHGSRQTAGNRHIEKLAAHLGVTAAFWAVAPNLETRLMELIQQGHQQLTVLPLFLFPGTITDAIMRQAEALAERFPRLRLRLLPPLGSSEILAAVITALLFAALPTQPLAAESSESLMPPANEIHV
jgi:sirohydrochlorin cobaltochelatase